MPAVPPVGVPVAHVVRVPEVLITAESQPAASPAHLANVDAEATAIQAAFGGAAFAEVQRNISVSELKRLLAGRTTWCFPGHGDAMLQSEPVLAFVGEGGAIEVVSIDTLVNTVRPHVVTGKLKLVVLTGCCTARLARALRERAFVPYVVCWETVLEDTAGRIFGTAFAQAVANGAEPLEAFQTARTAVCTETEPGNLDTDPSGAALNRQVQKFDLDVDPKDAALVNQTTYRLILHPGARRGRLAAGTPKLLRYESIIPHDVPVLPKYYMPRPEQWDLRAALVNGARGDGTVVGIVGACPVTGIAGTAGLGKTTTANWLALDPCVRSAFRDGVFWLEFGKERTAMELLMHLAKRLGLAKRPREDDSQILGMDEHRSMDEVCDDIAQRLKGRRCLIILDDVWEEEQPMPFQRLAGGRVTVLMTTRKSFIVEAFGEQLAQLSLRPMEDESATRLMVQSSGKTLDELQGSSLTQLVKMCAGLPAMLRSVGRMCHGRSAEAVDAWFEDYKLSHSLPESMAKADGYIQDGRKGNLFLAFEGQLEWLKRQDEELEKRCTMCAVFPEDTEVPLGILSDLWGTDNAETREVVERLGGEHLVELVADGAMIRLLDPVRDYLRCRGKSALKGWQKHLLGACRTGKVGGAGSGYWDNDVAGYWETYDQKDREQAVQFLALAHKMHDGSRHFMHHLNGCNGELGVGSLGAIKMLSLINSGVGEAGAASLASALETNATLLTLNLADNKKMGDTGAASLASALEKNASLQELNLDSSRVGEAGAAALASALETNASLLTLNLAGNEKMGDTGATSLASALEKNASLQELDLERSRVGEAGATALASALENNATLQSLNLDSNGVGAAGAVSLASALEKNATLQNLQLDTNGVGTAGAASLASALEKNATLKQLLLRSNSVGEVGAASLASALEKNTVLQELGLDGNDVGGAGAASLALALEKNTALQCLHLNHNGVGDAGAATLASALEKNATLQELYLEDNGIGAAGAALLASALEKNTTLQYLRLQSESSDDMGDAIPMPACFYFEALARIASALHSNSSAAESYYL